MKKGQRKKLMAALLAWIMVLTIAPLQSGRAALRGVYFTAANEQLMELTGATMPFWSGSTLYVASSLFQGTDLGVNYVKNTAMGLAVLYTTKTDLRFDLSRQKVYDKEGNSYQGRAIVRGGVVFVPLDLVCRYFGLTWTYSETSLVPLIRVKSSNALLDDRSFIDAANQQMTNRYEAYEKLVGQQGGGNDLPPSYAVEGQKVHLVIESGTEADTKAAVELLGEVQATFLLTAEQMAQGDLVRCLVAKGHAIALKATGESAQRVAEEVELGRELLRQASCSWLNLVWYEGEADIAPLLKELGCRAVRTELDFRNKELNSAARARNIQTEIGRYREDVTVFLGMDANCLLGLEPLLDGLKNGKYRVCAWRMGL